MISLLFTDIVGPTRSVAQLGDRGWLRPVDMHHAKVRELWIRFDGREVDRAGDVLRHVPHGDGRDPLNREAYLLHIARRV